MAPHIAAARDLRQQHLRPFDQRAGAGLSGRVAPALLRHALLQSAALHAPGRADRRSELPSRSSSTSSKLSSSRRWARASCAPRTRRISSPTASACSRCWRRWCTRERFGLGFDVVDALTGPAIGRARSATYRTCDVVGLDTMAHVIRTMHETLPDDPWHRVLPAARVAAGAHRQGRARAENEGRLLPEGRQGDPGARSGFASVSAGAGRDRAGGGRDPGLEGARRAVGAAARACASAGAVPVGDLSRPVSLLRLSPGHDRGQRARRRFRAPLGLRLEAGTVRNLAGGRLAAGGELDCRGHRRRQGARQPSRCPPG